MNIRASRIAFFLLVALNVRLTAVLAADAKPNIIVIVGDDMGYADIGVHGCKDIPTPNIDALAAAGTRCTNGYVSGPYCSPTRAGLLTGRYQTRFGHEFNPGGEDRTPSQQPENEEQAAQNDAASEQSARLVCRSRKPRSPIGSRRPATRRAGSASGTSAASCRLFRRIAASTIRSAFSAARTDISPTRSRRSAAE